MQNSFWNLVFEEMKIDGMLDSDEIGTKWKNEQKMEK